MMLTKRNRSFNRLAHLNRHVRFQSCVRRQRLLSVESSCDKKVGRKEQQLIRFSPFIRCPETLLAPLTQLISKRSGSENSIKTIDINNNDIINERYEYAISMQKIPNDRLYYVDEASFRLGSIKLSVWAAISISGRCLWNGPFIHYLKILLKI